VCCICSFKRLWCISLLLIVTRIVWAAVLGSSSGAGLLLVAVVGPVVAAVVGVVALAV
jgi:hypothetical protein